MKKLCASSLLLIMLLSLLVTLPVAFGAKPSGDNADVQEYVFVLTLNSAADGSANKGNNPHGQGGGLNGIPPTDNSMTNPDYSLLSFHWYSTISYYVNPTNTYSFSISAVVNAVTTSAGTWDVETNYQVFSYKGTTTRVAGQHDGFNVVSWGTYSQANAIAVTFIWASGRRMVETDCVMNVQFGWSLNGESGKMDVQNIMTHEFGHWCGLNDLYKNKDYWLTMYGYADYGQTWKQTLGLGDINGLQRVYGV
jgi:hypothetical protein